MDGIGELMDSGIEDCRLKMVFKTLRLCGELLLFFSVLLSIFFLSKAYAGEPFDFDFDTLLEEAEPEGRIAEQGPFDFGGFIQVTGALDTEHDKAGEHTRMVRNTIRLEGRWNPVQETTDLRHSSSSRFHALASVEWDYLLVWA